MSETAPVWDAVVVGAGPAGAATALGLQLALGGGGRVMLCDPALGVPQPGHEQTTFRAVAIAPDCQRFLAEFGAWSSIALQAQPVLRMDITDAREGLLPNPRLLSFLESDGSGGPLAYLSYAEPLKHALLERCAAAGVVLDGSGGRDVRQKAWFAELTTQDGSIHATRLLVAADGGRSRLRHAARIQTIEKSYPESAIIATLNHTIGHGGRAVQHFFPGGPIALLPLTDAAGGDTRTSLVWTERHDEAERLAALSPEVFCAALQARVGYVLGQLSLEDRPLAHPLRLQLAKSLVTGRLALVGDAARVIHPLAGQGLNLGLRDAECLVRQARSAIALGLDPGAHSVLHAYQRDRRPASALMAAGTDMLDQLFSSDDPSLRTLRDVGLGVVDRVAPLKRGFARSAAGYDPVRDESSESPLS